jgi:hypothetical protein
MTRCPDPAIAELLGAYALGACTEPEREAVRAHLGGCAACTRELADLALARDALLTDVAAEPAPPAMKERVMAQVRAEAELFDAARAARREPPAPARRGTLGRLAGRLRAPVPAAAAVAGALALAVAGGVVGAGLSDGGGAPARTVAASVDALQAPQGRARLVVRDGRGALVVSGMPAPGPGRVYQVWLRRGAGTPVPAGALFSVSRSGAGEAAVPGPLAGVDEVLVSSEPAGGSRAPTRAPVLAVRV